MSAILMAAVLAQDVRFEGASAIPERTLREVIQPDLERYAADPRQAVLDDAAFRLANYYRTQGHHFVEVRVITVDHLAVFRIQEGPVVEIGRLHFRGNTVFKTRELEAMMPKLPGLLAPFSDRLVAMQVQTVLDAYRSRGYLDVGVAEPVLRYDEERGRMNVTLVIAEGRRYVVSDVVTDDEIARDAGQRLVGEPFTRETAARFQAAIIDRYRDAGHPAPRVRVASRVDREAGSAALEAEVEPGARARIAALRIAGSERTRESFIRSRAGLDVGAPFSASALQQAEERLRRTGLFRTVSVAVGEFQEETGDLTVDVRLEEREPGEVAARGGYGTLEGPRIGADAAYANVFGGAEVVRASVTYSRFGFRPAAEVAVPYLFGTELRFGTSVHYEERRFPSFDAVSYGGFPSLSLEVAERLDVTAGVRAAFIRTTDVEEDVPPGDLLDFDYRALSLSASLDRRDDPALPGRGYVVSALAEWSGGLLESDIEFLRAGGAGALFVPLPGDLVFALGMRGGVIVPIGGTDVIPIALRTFAGGTNTVRGFEFGTLGPQAGGEPTGGEVFLAAQSEVRFPIWSVLHGAVFADRGGVWFDHRDVDLDETRYSIGAGVRVYTAGGALAADVAWNVRREEGEDPVEFHISVGFPF